VVRRQQQQQQQLAAAAAKTDNFNVVITIISYSYVRQFSPVQTAFAQQSAAEIAC